LEIIISYYGWVLLVSSLFFGLKYHSYFKSNLKLIFPYFVINVFILLSFSAMATFRGISYDVIILFLKKNSWQLLRASYFAVVGAMLFNAVGLPIPIQPITRILKRISQISPKIMISIIMGHFVYTVILFAIFSLKPLSNTFMLMGMVRTIMIDASEVFIEEFTFRLFLMGLIVYLFHKLKFNEKWVVAILISGSFWALLHLQNPTANWIKVVQMLPLGIILGWVMKKYGFEASLFFHLITNILMLTLLPYVLLNL